MDELTLKSIIQSHISGATGFLDTQIAQEREEALEYYRGDPFGNEQEGKSQVVSKDVMDTVEWIMPQLIKLFHGSDRVVEFEPEGPEDEAIADQATSYVNFVYNRDNQGFLNTYTVAKDALIQKVGIWKHWWDTSVVTREARYSGLTEDELAEVAGDDDVEIIEQDTQDNLFDIRIRRTISKGRVRIEPVPPEEFLTSRRAKSLADADFLAHRTTKTRSELISMGFDPGLVMNLPAGDSDLTGERENRYDDEDTDEQANDPAQEEVQVTECYLLVDFDEDGISELRKVTVAGTGNDILDNEEVPEHPFTVWSPIIMPHRLWGMSVAEAIKDLQLIKSTLLRQMLDNLYITNSPEYEVVTTQVDPDGGWDDAFVSHPGGIKRVLAPDTYRVLEKPFVAGQAFPVLEYIDRKMEGRTGVAAAAIGANPDLLQNQTATGVNAVLSHAQERIALIARVFAETGFRPLMKAILRLLVRYQDKERVVRLRNEFVPMDPRFWNADMDVCVDVGLGTGTKDRQLAHMASVLEYQIRALENPQLGLISSQNVFNALDKYTKLMGLRGADMFFTNPSSPEGLALAQAASENRGMSDAEALVQMEQMKAQVKMQDSQADRQFDLLKLQIEDDRERDKFMGELMVRVAEAQARTNAQIDIAEIKREMERERNIFKAGTVQ